MPVERSRPICVECRRCGHRAVLDAEALCRHGLRPDVTVAELSRALVCQECGSRSTRAFRAETRAARDFVAG